MKADTTFRKICRRLRGDGLVFTVVTDGQALKMDVGLDGPAGSATLFVLVDDVSVQVSAVVATNARDALVGAAELACRINYRLRFGKFDIDWSDGEIRFSVVEPLSILRWRAGNRAADMIAMVCSAVERYGPAFIAVAAGLQSPAAAARQVLGEEDAAETVGADGAKSRPPEDGGGTAAEERPRGDGAGNRIGTAVDAAVSNGKAGAIVRDYSLAGLNVRGVIPINKVETAIRNYLALVGEQEANALPDRPRMNILLSGPPGAGKTEFVRYLGEKFGLPVVVRSAGDLLDKFVGNTEKAIRAAFAEASKRRSILFFDEFDGILRNRAEATAEWVVSHTNEILRGMEDFDGIVIAATNLAERLDPAVIRRFTYKFEFGYLTSEGKEFFFRRAFATELTEEERRRLNAIPDLAPGDFKTASQALYYLGENLDNAARLDALAREADFKNDRRKAWTDKAEPPRIGFLQPTIYPPTPKKKDDEP